MPNNSALFCPFRRQHAQLLLGQFAVVSHLELTELGFLLLQIRLGGFELALQELRSAVGFLLALAQILSDEEVADPVRHLGGDIRRKRAIRYPEGARPVGASAPLQTDGDIVAHRLQNFFPSPFIPQRGIEVQFLDQSPETLAAEYLLLELIEPRFQSGLDCRRYEVLGDLLRFHQNQRVGGVDPRQTEEDRRARRDASHPQHGNERLPLPQRPYHRARRHRETANLHLKNAHNDSPSQSCLLCPRAVTQPYTLCFLSKPVCWAPPNRSRFPPSRSAAASPPIRQAGCDFWRRLQYPPPQPTARD